MLLVMLVFGDVYDKLSGLYASNFTLDFGKTIAGIILRASRNFRTKLEMA